MRVLIERTVYVRHDENKLCLWNTYAPLPGNIHKGNERKLQIFGIFLSPKYHNSVENGLIAPNIELDLDIIMINLYIKFNF